MIHWYVQPRSGLAGFFCTFVYVFNERSIREELWTDLSHMKTRDP